MSVRQQPKRSITELHDSAMTMPHFSNKEHISPKLRLDYFMLAARCLTDNPTADAALVAMNGGKRDQWK
ncbi:hypothetical protein [Caballeronia sordidicola]|jgi:hypothetical protein|uniref:hypothetical protein n=1 Tax=Caballeronia sordidicola TaxID=196367 RepID=UPI00126A316F|nr:hypothetical protein [Caballeronia sordidicola]